MNNADYARISVPGILRNRCNGAPEIATAARTVRAALDDIESRHHALYVCICDDTGAVRRHVNLFVNRSHIRDLDGLDTALAPGDVLIVLPAVSGG
jgi:molybdopterin converting factor small subunit